MKMIKPPIIKIVLFSVVTLIITFIMMLMLLSTSTDNINQENHRADYNYKLLTHRLVKYDLDSGLADRDTAGIAWSNINNFLSNVERTCKHTNSTTELLECANKILGMKFKYQVSDIATPAYSSNYSDCDLNVYLLFDAVKFKNKKINIVYAPHHAFISYFENNRQINFWETVTDNNSGGMADLNNNHLYNKTFDKFYYTSQGEDYIEALYPILTAYQTTSIQRRKNIYDKLSENIKQTPLALDLFYGNKKTLTENDASKLYSLLRTDITSSEKRLLLSHYLIEKNRNTEAKKIIKLVPNEYCGIECMTYKAEISHLENIPLSIARIAAHYNVRLNEFHAMIYLIINITLILLYVIFFIETNKKTKLKNKILKAATRETNKTLDK